ncbi:DUF262 domain-containing protein [Streptococcus ruminantium]|uniref:DUF262 domain-containing protein n=1 Tax=Streptococcus ruminantium TaxID=1917441 RepID=UPI0012DE3996|nr:DUF262 domain-containing protein [Streptococcus ruminantium]
MKSKTYYGEYSLYHWMQLILKKNIVLPDYQRLFVWKKEKTSKLIESLSKNEFVPPVTIGAYDNGEMKLNLILDGQQRLTSIFLSYLGIFPDKKSFKKTLELLIDEDDSEFEKEDLDDILEWSFKKLTEKGNTKDKILSNVIDGNYEELETVDEEFLKSHYLGFSYLVPQKENNETDENFFSEQQKFYSSVFRNINVQGEILLPQESRKSLYFLKDSLANFFDPEFTSKITINDSKMDFVRYIALVSHWRKEQNINKVGYGYARKMENLYEEFIYFVVDNSDGKQPFEHLPDYVRDGNYASLISDISKIFHRICQEMEFSSIIDMDVVAFGLIEYMIFEQKKIDESKISNLILELKDKIGEFKKDYLHTKNPSALKHLRSRMQSSKEIYRKYVE